MPGIIFFAICVIILITVFSLDREEYTEVKAVIKLPKNKKERGDHLFDKQVICHHCTKFFNPFSHNFLWRGRSGFPDYMCDQCIKSCGEYQDIENTYIIVERYLDTRYDCVFTPLMRGLKTT